MSETDLQGLTEKQYKERVQTMVDLLWCHQKVNPAAAARNLNSMAVDLVHQIAKELPSTGCDRQEL